MAVIRLTEDHLQRVRDHIFAAEVEGFAFLLCRWEDSNDGPVFVTEEVVLINHADVDTGDRGWSLTDEALDRVLNRAAVTELALVEIHNHRLGPPRFSRTDRSGLLPFATFVVDSFPDRPYAATVWAGNLVYGEFFDRRDSEIRQDTIRSITAVGPRLRQLASTDTEERLPEAVFDRQLPLFGTEGQRTLARLRVGIVGLGGTGSHVAQALAYLGVRDFVLVDADVVETTNLNRVVTASPADLATPKTMVARRLIRTVAPDATVTAIEERVGASQAATLALTGTDIIFGCVDDDGPRLLLNRIAIAAAIPYFDAATGVEMESGVLTAAGGRVAVTLPGGPCLACTDELDINEVRSYFLEPDERRRQAALGYIRGADEPAPAVVSLNGLVVHCALNELTAFVAGVRPPAYRIDADLLGAPNSGLAGPRLTPRRGVRRRPGCPDCIPGLAVSLSPERSPRSAAPAGSTNT